MKNLFNEENISPLLKSLNLYREVDVPRGFSAAVMDRIYAEPSFDNLFRSIYTKFFIASSAITAVVLVLCIINVISYFSIGITELGFQEYFDFYLF